MEPELVAGHPALDFLNTIFSPQGELVETIPDGRSFLDWLIRSGLLSDPAATRLKRRLSAEDLDAAAAAARGMRTWADAWIGRWSRAPSADYRAEVRRLNGWLQHGTWHREIQAADGSFTIADVSRSDNADDLLGLIAFQLASLVAVEAPTLVKRCAGAGCTLWFLDRTKGHRRLYCSASACGNRAKVAAFRARHLARR